MRKKTDVPNAWKIPSGRTTVTSKVQVTRSPVKCGLDTWKPVLAVSRTSRVRIRGLNLLPYDPPESPAERSAATGNKI